MSTNTLRGTWTFFTYELRRLLPTMALGLILWPLCLLGRRWIEKDWNYWGDDSWALIGLVLTLLTIPVMTVAMASSGWAGERATGTLAWTLARPLSAGRLFFVRVAALLAMLSAFGVVSLALHLGFLGWHRAAERGAELQRFVSFDLSSFALGLGAILLAGSLLASTLAESGRKVLGILVLILAAYALSVLGLLWVVTPERAAIWVSGAVRAVFQVHWALFLTALLAGAWGAIRRAHEDRARWRHAAFSGGPAALLSGVVLLLLAIHPLGLGDRRVVAEHDLGEGARLQVLSSSWMDWRFGVPRISRDGQETILPLALGAWLVHSDRRRGLSVLPRIPAAWWENRTGLPPHYNVWHRKVSSRRQPVSEWIVIDRDGNHWEVGVPKPGLWLHALGWSPSGEHFAWWDSDSKVVIADGDLRESRILDFGTHHIVPRWTEAYGTPRHTPHWTDEDLLVWTTEVDETPGLAKVRILAPGGEVRDGCVMPLSLSTDDLEDARPRYPRFYGAAGGWAVWTVYTARPARQALGVRPGLLLACHLETVHTRLLELSGWPSGIFQGGIVLDAPGWFDPIRGAVVGREATQLDQPDAGILLDGEEIPFTEMRTFEVPAGTPGGAK